MKAITASSAAPLLMGAWRASGQTVDQQAPTQAAASQSIAIGGYRLEFTHSLEELVGDLAQTERGDPRRQSNMPYSEWYSERTRRRSGSWGPHPRHYPPPAGLSEAPVAWQRERVVATAARFIGYAYQHHHIPDWDPPPEWPWKQCCAGHNGKGVDCSNFTSFVYNQGFGIRFSAAIRRQAEIDHALETPHESITLRTIEPAQGRERAPADAPHRRPGLHPRSGRRTDLARRDLGRLDRPLAQRLAPLVLDSHGSDVHDDAGQAIPLRHLSCGRSARIRGTTAAPATPIASSAIGSINGGCPPIESSPGMPTPLSPSPRNPAKTALSRLFGPSV